VKHSTRFYGLVAIIGFVFLALVLLVAYLDFTSSLIIFGNILALLSPRQFGFLFVLGGIAFLTVGIAGIERHCFKRHRKWLSCFSIFWIPSLTFVTFFLVLAFIFLSVVPLYPMRSEITNVSVVDDSPLVLSVSVKSITSRDSRIDSALILNSNDTLVASYCNEEIMVNGVSTFEPICVFPAGSEINVTLDFNTALPSGNYIVRLSSWHYSHCDSLFTIP
jgi:hypothetical protein